MNVCRVLPNLLLSALMAGCSVLSSASEVDSLQRENEIQRTTYCVYGGLPMEVRFNLPNNPPRLLGPVLTQDSIDKIAVNLDSQIARLLKLAMENAWRDVQKIRPGTPQFADELQSAFVSRLVEHAPGSLQLQFCGDADSVGNAVSAALAGYFARSIDANNLPVWLNELPASARGRSTSIVILAVSLRLAKVEISLDLLLSSFTRPHK